MQTELKHAVPRHPHSSLTGEPSGDRSRAAPGDRVEGKARSLDIMRVVSAEARPGSVGSHGNPENASATANACPMSPQISADGQYRFFMQSDMSNQLLKDGSSISGDNPFFSVGPHAPRTLAEHLAPHRVAFSELEKEWKPHMRLQSILYGVVPSYVGYLAMCESSLKAFQLIPPNMLSVSKLLGGMGAPKDLISLAMIASSQAAGAVHAPIDACIELSCFVIAKVCSCE